MNSDSLEKRDFFCSELIVKCYKEMGILKTNKSSSTFTPQDLSITAKNPIKLEPGYELKED
jgi:hypothetical protein